MHSVWTTKQGLPSDSINDILQDDNGYIWIGTFNGLARFDGINFRVFSKYDRFGFDSNSVTALVSGKDGSIWIGTNGEGIAKYQNEKFKMFNGPDLKGRIIKDLSVDDSGSIWIAAGDGLLKSHREGSFSEPFDGYFREKSIELIYHDLNGKLWISTADGSLFVYDGNKPKPHPLSEKFKNTVVVSVLKDDSENLWIGTKSEGLFLLHKGILHSFNKEGSFNVKTLNSLSRGKHGCIWISTDSGLFRYFKNRFYRYSEKNGLSSNQVNRIMEDKEGSLWIATSRGGVNKLSNGKFLTITTTQGLIHDRVNTVFEGKDETLWVGTDGGLSIFDPNGNVIENKITEKLKGIRIRHIAGDTKERIWISTYSDMGIVSFEKGGIKNYSINEGMSSNRCRVSSEDQNGNIWVGTSNGLNRIDGKGKIVTYLKKDGLADNYIMSVFEDSENRLWISTNGGGISILENNEFRTVSMDSGLSSNVIFRTYEDNQKKVWISGSRGISRYDNGRVFNYSVKNGIPERAVFQMIEDKDQRFWMVAETGIFTVLKQDLNRIAREGNGSCIPTLYNDLDGLLDSPTPVSWAVLSPGGTCWFPTLKGIASINTKNIPINKKPPPLLIESIKIDNDHFSPVQIYSLHSNYRRITFYYTALSYIIPHKIQYKYMLEGFDESWSELTTKREVSYTTLPPGDYKFRVQAVNNDGVWNTGDVSVSFSQKPLFYQTIWFLILTVLIFLGIIAGILGLRIWTLKKRGIELEKLVADRTEELETTDRIVANINKEIRIDKLFQKLMKQTMMLFPQAEKGVILTLNRETEKFKPSVSSGYDMEKISDIHLSFDEAIIRYMENAEEFEKGIFVHNDFGKNRETLKRSQVDTPESMIAMPITFNDSIDSFFILENMNDPAAFKRSDAKKLVRIREHAVTAVFKARTHQKLEEAAIIDSLTGLHNRRKMIEVLETEKIRTERTDQPFCIVMADIDHFKSFNDTHGHDCGDFVLVEVSRLVRSTIRKQDFIGRWGGEEFLLIYPETLMEGGRTVTEKVRSAIENTDFIFNGTALKITMTFGMALFSKGKTIDGSIKEADDALYIGKQKGRNRVVISEKK